MKQHLGARAQCREIELGFLGKQDVVAYLDARFGCQRVPAAFAHAIALHTAGNPLFMVRVVDDLVSRGVLRQVNGQWQATGDADVVAQSIPESMASLIERELEQLDELERSILETASVAGTEFSSLAVAAGAGQHVFRVEDVCMRWIKEGRFIKPAGSAERAMTAVTLRGSFLHPLYRRVIYAQIGPARRAEVHRRIGLLEKRAGVGGVALEDQRTFTCKTNT
jgi:predicted ATPase